MNRFRLSLPVLTLAITLLAAVSSTVAAPDHVIVQPRRVVIIRTGKVVRDFPECKKAIVRYATVRGLSDLTIPRRIQNCARDKECLQLYSKGIPARLLVARIRL
jgi:hypothetical protein